MCCRERTQYPPAPRQFASPRRRGCCGSRLTAYPTEKAVYQHHSNQLINYRRSQQPSMAGLIAISIGLGAEKLGRTISEKRLERKEKKAIAVWTLL